MATKRQLLAFNKMVENGGNVSAAMREAGYSDAMSHNPQKLLQSKAWQELSAEILPMEELIKSVRGLVDSDNMSIRAKGLDMAFRLRGMYRMHKSTPLHDPLDDLSDVELDAEIAKAEIIKKQRIAAS